MRGRIINKFSVGIARLDEAATDAVVGWDPDFHEPLPVDDGSQLGQDSRRYHGTIYLPCQLDRDESWGRSELTHGGQQPKADIVLVMEQRDLERGGYLDSDMKPIFRRGDKVIEILTRKGAKEIVFDDPPGMFVTGWDRAGYGLAAFGTSRVNLLFLYCSYDEAGT